MPQELCCTRAKAQTSDDEQHGNEEDATYRWLLWIWRLILNMSLLLIWSSNTAITCHGHEGGAAQQGVWGFSRTFLQEQLSRGCHRRHIHALVLHSYRCYCQAWIRLENPPLGAVSGHNSCKCKPDRLHVGCCCKNDCVQTLSNFGGVPRLPNHALPTYQRKGKAHQGMILPPEGGLICMPDYGKKPPF